MDKENGTIIQMFYSEMKKLFIKSNIPHFIISSGLDGENILVATQELVTNKYELKN